MTDTPTQKPRLAYEVLENDENTACIVFARSSVAARRIGAHELADGDFSGVRCRRVPWADPYVGRGVPAALAVANGWNFECAGCASPIDEEEQEWRGLTVDRVYGAVAGAVFCCVECAADDRYETEKRQAIGDAVLAEFRAIVRSRFGDVEFVTGSGREHVYVTHEHVVQQAFVSFRFPGQKYGPATYRWDNERLTVREGWRERDAFGPAWPHFSVCNGDVDAWRAFTGQPPAAAAA
jgi:hypothetical protein